MWGEFESPPASHEFQNQKGSFNGFAVIKALLCQAFAI